MEFSDQTMPFEIRPRPSPPPVAGQSRQQQVFTLSVVLAGHPPGQAANQLVSQEVLQSGPVGFTSSQACQSHRLSGSLFVGSSPGSWAGTGPAAEAGSPATASPAAGRKRKRPAARRAQLMLLLVSADILRCGVSAWGRVAQHPKCCHRSCSELRGCLSVSRVGLCYRQGVVARPVLYFPFGRFFVSSLGGLQSVVLEERGDGVNTARVFQLSVQTEPRVLFLTFVSKYSPC